MLVVRFHRAHALENRTHSHCLSRVGLSSCHFIEKLSIELRTFVIDGKIAIAGCVGAAVAEGAAVIDGSLSIARIASIRIRIPATISGAVLSVPRTIFSVSCRVFSIAVRILAVSMRILSVSSAVV